VRSPPDERMLGIECPCPMFANQIVADHRSNLFVREKGERVELMRGAKSIEEVKKRDARLDRRRLCYQRVSCASCTEADDIIAKPVPRTAITIGMVPKIDSAEVRERERNMKTVPVNSPAILNMSGIINKRPCDAVNVVVSAPDCNAPWSTPAAPPSLCIS